MRLHIILTLLVWVLAQDGFGRALEIITSSGTEQFPSPGLGIGPSEFDLVSEGILVEYNDACMYNEKEGPYTAGFSGRIVVIPETACTPGELIGTLEGEDVVGVIILVDAEIPGAGTYTWDGNDYAEITIPAVEMYTKAWGGRRNATIHLTPTSNPWDGINSDVHWGIFSAIFGVLNICFLVVCIYKLRRYVRNVGYKAELPQLVLSFETAGSLLSILWLIDPSANHKIWTSSISLSLMIMSFPFSIATNFMVATYWLKIVKSRPTRKQNLKNWWILCGICIGFVFVVTFGVVILQSVGSSSKFSATASGVIYAFFFGTTGLLLFYASREIWLYIRDMRGAPLTFARYILWLTFAGAVSTICILCATMMVPSAFFKTPAGFGFTYWIMFSGRSLLTGSQIFMWNAPMSQRSANTMMNTKTTKVQDPDSDSDSDEENASDQDVENAADQKSDHSSDREHSNSSFSGSGSS